MAFFFYKFSAAVILPPLPFPVLLTDPACFLSDQVCAFPLPFTGFFQGCLPACGQRMVHRDPGLSGSCAVVSLCFWNFSVELRNALAVCIHASIYDTGVGGMQSPVRGDVPGRGWALTLERCPRESVLGLKMSCRLQGLLGGFQYFPLASNACVAGGF